MKFEYDLAKRELTLRHRRLDFAEAGQVSSEWVDPDDAPQLDRAWFDKATVKLAGQTVNSGGRPRGSNKEQVALRLDRDMVERFRAGGPGWQSRMNQALRSAVGL